MAHLRSHRRGWSLVAALALLPFLALPIPAQDDGDASDFEEAFPRYSGRLEIKAHYRDSDLLRRPSPFTFDMLDPPITETVFMETVEAGSHTELSVVTLEGLAEWREDLAARVKIDLVDRYDRNPTSEDREVDVDEAWFRYGREAEPAEVPERRAWYAKLGKFGKFERQDDRHLESYGLVSTAFNRLEDVGLEVGFDLTRNLYLKASFTEGNPVFIRDPNVLAGDNGTEDEDLGTGITILYDADVDRIGFDHPEVGLGLGYRWSSASGFVSLDVLAWGYERELAREAELSNTFYGGDLDVLDGPEPTVFPLASLPISGDEKREVGLNLWLYAGNFALFGQYVDQEMAGLDRTGFEVEASYLFELPWMGSVAGRQLFPWIAPAVRYSELDPDFPSIPPTNFPAVSVAWDWEKLDLGLRFAVIEELEVTLEWQDNTPFLFNGNELSNDEFLLTLALALQGARPRLLSR